MFGWLKRIFGNKSPGEYYNINWNRTAYNSNYGVYYKTCPHHCPHGFPRIKRRRNTVYATG